MRPQTLMATLTLLAGCAGSNVTVERPCYVPPMTWHADDPSPFMRLEMLNVGRWCGITVSQDRRASERRGSIAAQPAHGRARIRTTSAGATAEYLPTAGYAGGDSFRFSMGAGAPVMTVDVRVVPSSPAKALPEIDERGPPKAPLPPSKPS